MDFSWSETQQKMRQSAVRFAQQSLSEGVTDRDRTESSYSVSKSSQHHPHAPLPSDPATDAQNSNHPHVTCRCNLQNNQFAANLSEIDRRRSRSSCVGCKTAESSESSPTLCRKFSAIQLRKIPKDFNCVTRNAAFRYSFHGISRFNNEEHHSAATPWSTNQNGNLLRPLSDIFLTKRKQVNRLSLKELPCSTEGVDDLYTS